MAEIVLPGPSDPQPWGKVDEIGLESRCRPPMNEGDRQLAAACCDLTSLEGSDTGDKIHALCEKAKLHRVAAVCVYPALVSVAAEALRGSGVKVASVAGGFPSGLYPLESTLLEIRFAIESGADEIDTVMNRGAFLSEEYRTAYDELLAMRGACGDKTMKVILETGELPDYDAIRNASFIAMQAGADFVKSSTGKIPVGATPMSVLCIADAVRDFYNSSRRKVGIKPSGGIRKAEDALLYIALVRETLGDDWMDPNWFRLGASSLLDELAAP